jgi:hypothetical protein
VSVISEPCLELIYLEVDLVHLDEEGGVKRFGKRKPYSK